MRNVRCTDLEANIEEQSHSLEMQPETSPHTKLERRRRIEDLFAEKQLREELEFLF